MSNNIKKLRVENNLTQKQFSEQIHMPVTTLAQYERGEREPKLATWQKLADFFEVSVPYMQGYDSKVDALINNWKNSQILEIIERLNKLQTDKYDFSYDRKVFDALSILLSIYSEYPKNSYIIDKLNDIIITLQYFENDISLDELFSDSTLPDCRNESDQDINEDIILSSALQFESLLRLMNDNKSNSN